MTFYILKYIDGADYRCVDRLFKDKYSALKAGVETFSSWGYEEEFDNLKNATLEEKIEIFKKEEYYPLKNYNNFGCYYHTIQEIELE